jgi:hypothetical protein
MCSAGTNTCRSRSVINAGVAPEQIDCLLTVLLCNNGIDCIWMALLLIVQPPDVTVLLQCQVVTANAPGV